MNAIFCYGVREPESAKISSLSPERTALLCQSFDVVVDETHYVDVQERAITCVWNVFLKDLNQIHSLVSLFNAVLRDTLGISVSSKKEVPAFNTTRQPTFVFSWRGSDSPQERPPVHVRHVLSLVETKLDSAGFRVSIDRMPQL